MKNGNLIEHPGVVSRIENNRVIVSILAQTACQSCHAKSTCGLGTEDIKEIEFTDVAAQFKTGEQVKIIMQESTGMMAMILGYFVPFIILILSLVFFVLLTKNEGIAALAALFCVALYYLIIYFLKGKLSGKMTFSIEKI